MKLETLNIGILTLSDRASRGEYEDRSGPEIWRYLEERLANPVEWHSQVIADEYDQIVEQLIRMADDEGCHWICTTGGTGPAPRDVTPEATEEACDKMLPGFGEQMRLESLKYVPTAILSRQTAGIRGNSFIINLPGSPKAIAECLDAVIDAIPYCIELIGGPVIEYKPEFGKAWRPKK